MIAPSKAESTSHREIARDSEIRVTGHPFDQRFVQSLTR